MRYQVTILLYPFPLLSQHTKSAINADLQRFIPPNMLLPTESSHQLGIASDKKLGSVCLPLLS